MGSRGEQGWSIEENRVGIERKTGLEYRGEQGWSKEENMVGVEENRVGVEVNRLRE